MRSIGNKSIPLVIGLGNIYRGDDGLGILVINALRSNHPGIADYLTEEGDATRLIDLWEGRDVIVIDAVKTSRQQSGRIHQINSIEELSGNTEIQFSTHSIDLSEVIGLSTLIEKPPGSLFFIGVEGSVWEMGAIISDKVKSQIPEVVEMTISHIRNSQKS